MRSRPSAFPSAMARMFRRSDGVGIRHGDQLGSLSEEYATPVGKNVFPFMFGQVEEVLRRWLSVGSAVVVGHTLVDGRHLFAIYESVGGDGVVGQEVTTSTKIGLTGQRRFWGRPQSPFSQSSGKHHHWPICRDGTSTILWRQTPTRRRPALQAIDIHHELRRAEVRLCTTEPQRRADRFGHDRSRHRQTVRDDQSWQ